LVAGHIESCRFAVYCARCHSHGPVFGYNTVCDDDGVLLDEYVDMVKDSYHDLDDFLIQRAIECWNKEDAKPEKVDDLQGKRIEVPYNGLLETGTVESWNDKGGIKIKTDEDSPNEGNTIWVYPRTGQVRIFKDVSDD
jgi:hypothetical protein